MSQYTFNTWLTENRDHYVQLTRLATKEHRSRKSVEFLNACSNKNVLPNFTRLKRETITQGRLSPKDVANIRRKRLAEAITTQTTRLNFLTQQLKFEYTKILRNTSNRTHTKIEYRVKNQIAVQEKKRDQNRDKFLRDSTRKRTYAEITIFNSSDINIPQNVLNALKYGYNRPIGGRPNTYHILSSFEQLYRKWSEYAKSQNIGFFTILEARTKMLLAFNELTKCYTDNCDAKCLKDFLKLHPELLILQIDKSKNIEIMTQDQYISKLQNVFSDETKFE